MRLMTQKAKEESLKKILRDNDAPLPKAESGEEERAKTNR